MAEATTLSSVTAKIYMTNGSTSEGTPKYETTGISGISPSGYTEAALRAVVTAIVTNNALFYTFSHVAVSQRSLLTW